ncbi:MAG: hypothetical protein ACR2KP_04945, partial [Egibacteraceae bacterium]
MSAMNLRARRRRRRNRLAPHFCVSPYNVDEEGRRLGQQPILLGFFALLDGREHQLVQHNAVVSSTTVRGRY